jgi:hypothetical protein
MGSCSACFARCASCAETRSARKRSRNAWGLLSHSVGAAQPSGQTAMTTEVVGRRLRLASPTTALLLGVLGLALLVIDIPLAVMTHDLRPKDFAGGLLFGLLLAMGVFLARRQPSNPIGWIFACVVVALALYDVAGRYSVLDYHFHLGDLPLGAAAVSVASNLWISFFLALPPVILLFPDGRLSRPWRAVLWAYLGLAFLGIAYVFGATARNMYGQRISVDGAGQLVNNPNPIGLAGVLLTVGLIVLVVFWLSFVVHQVFCWRRSTGERRQQLKWLMVGAGLSVSGLVGTFLSAQYSGTLSAVLHVCSFGILALPVSICVAILRFRLYDIDRLVSRTLSYGIVTGSRHRRVRRSHHSRRPECLGFSSRRSPSLPRRWRRLPSSIRSGFAFNASSIAASTAPATTRWRQLPLSRPGCGTPSTLKTVRTELLEVVNRAVEPAHASVWIRRRE